MRIFLPALGILAALATAVPRPAGAQTFGESEESPALPAVTVLGADRRGVVLAVDLPGLRSAVAVVEGRPFVRWTLPGGASTRDPGRPEVPVLARLLATEGAGMDVRVRDVAYVPVEGVDLAPFVERPTRCGRPGRPGFCDPAAYAMDAFLPARWAEVEDAGSLHGVPLGRLVVHPVRWNAARREAWVARRMVLEVAFLPAAAGPAFRSRGVPASVDAVLRRAVPNWRVARDGAPQVPDRLMVVVADGLVDAVGPLVEWKRRRGLAVDVVPRSGAGVTAADLKAFVQAAWDGPERPTALLLVGDADGVPPLRGDDGCASDWRYAQLDGDDLVADLRVSRLAARDAADVDVQVARILALDATPPAGAAAAWIPAATLVSSSEAAGGPSDDERCDALAAVMDRHGYGPVDRLYRSAGTDRAEAIAAAVEAGRGLVAYLGHGSGYEWSTTVPPFDVDAVAAIQNPGRPPFVMDVSCANGQFDRGESLAEAWVHAGTAARPTGAVGMLSASTDTAWDEPAVMAQGFVEALLDDRRTALGDALEAGRAHLLQQFGATDTVRLVFQQYVLFGDATMDLRTRVPGPLVVDHPTALPVGDLEMAVSVSDGARPVPGALVALRKGDEVASAAYADAAGNASFPLSIATPGGLEVTVTAPDTVPYGAVVPVSVTGCGVLRVAPGLVPCGATLDVRLWDRDLDRDPGVPESVRVRVGLGDGEGSEVVLSETGPGGGAFRGTVDLGSGGLAAGHGDRPWVAYDDAACEGTPRVVTAGAAVDCRAPVMAGVALHDAAFDRVTVVLSTDEAAWVQAGLGAEPGVETVRGESSGKAHAVTLRGLRPGTDYALTLRAWDAVGNGSVAADPAWTVRTPDCTPACADRTCGDDGCGGACPPGCQAGQACRDGRCEGGLGCGPAYDPGKDEASCEACVCDRDPWCCETWDGTCAWVCEASCGGCGTGCEPSCGDRACGSNGCGGECGTCPAGTRCSRAGTCVPACAPACGVRACGDDGCGGACGLCPDPCTGSLSDGACADGACAACCPECGGRACGDDGCGGSCGTCGTGEACGDDGQCRDEPEPDPGPEAPPDDGADASPGDPGDPGPGPGDLPGGGDADAGSADDGAPEAARDEATVPDRGRDDAAAAGPEGGASLGGGACHAGAAPGGGPGLLLLALVLPAILRRFSRRVAACRRAGGAAGPTHSSDRPGGAP